MTTPRHGEKGYNELPKCDLCNQPARYRWHWQGITHHFCPLHFYPDQGEGWRTGAEELFTHEEITRGNPMIGRD